MCIVKALRRPAVGNPRDGVQSVVSQIMVLVECILGSTLGKDCPTCSAESLSLRPEIQALSALPCHLPALGWCLVYKACSSSASSGVSSSTEWKRYLSALVSSRLPLALSPRLCHPYPTSNPALCLQQMHPP